MNVIGLDVSSTCTGIAMPDGSTFVVQPRGLEHNPYERMHKMALGVARALNTADPDVAVIESAIGSYQGYAAMRIYEIAGLVRLLLHQRGVPKVEVKPSQLKLYATGFGGSKTDKEAMAAAARACRAEVGQGRVAGDRADAWWLRAIGVDHYGLDRHDDTGGRPNLIRIRHRVQTELAWPAALEEATAS